MRRNVLLFSLLSLLGGATSCASCESCKSGAGSNASTIADASTAPTPSPNEPAPSAAPAATSAATMSGGSLDANAACRLLARKLTQKACDCPQTNHVGCCFFGLEPLKAFDAAAPHLDCSRGRTDWPTTVEQRICANTKDTAKATAITNCYSAVDKLQCSRSPNGDNGVGLPKECENLFNAIEAAK